MRKSTCKILYSIFITLYDISLSSCRVLLSIVDLPIWLSCLENKLIAGGVIDVKGFIDRPLLLMVSFC